MTVNKVIQGLCLLWASGTVFADSLPSMVLITSDRFPGSGIEEVRSYGIKAWTLNVDAQTNVTKRLTSNLPTDEDDAFHLVRQRFSGITAEEAMSFYRPQALILKWDIRKLPAMVIGNGEYVLYGVSSYPEALALYEEYIQ